MGLVGQRKIAIVAVFRQDMLGRDRRGGDLKAVEGFGLRRSNDKNYMPSCVAKGV